MVAFLLSLIVTAAMVWAIVYVAKRRAPGTPLTWGEAMVAGVFVFTLLFWIYGVVPHQFLAWADNELAWRSDKVGIPLGPIGALFDVKDNVLFPEGVPLPNGQFVITAQTIRDIIAAGLYIVFLLGQIGLWLWWQKRGKKAEAAPELTSAYGRPLVKRA